MTSESRDISSNIHRTDSAARRLAMLMAIAAAVATEWAAGSIAGGAATAVRLTLLVGAAMAVRWWFRHRTARRVWTDAALVAVILLPVISRPLIAAALPAALAGAEGLEFSILAGLRNIALLAAAMGKVPRMCRIAGLSSLFVILFAFSLGDGGWLLLVVMIYAVLAVLWLMALHWSQLRPAPGGDSLKRLPRAPAAFLALGAVVATVLGILLYPDDMQSVVQMIAKAPGTSRENPDAAAQKRMEDAHRTALAHLTMQKYGPSSYAADEEEAGKSDPRRSGFEEAEPGWGDQGSGGSRRGPVVIEEFSILRRPIQEELPEAYNPQQVLFHTKGRGPRYVPVVSYDRFDGIAWKAEPRRFAPHITGEVVGKNMWLTVTHPPAFPLEPAALAEEAQRINASSSLAAAMEDPVAWGRTSVRRLWGDVPDSRLLEPNFIPIAPGYAAKLLAEEPDGSCESAYLLSPYDDEVIERRLSQTPELRGRLETLLHDSPRMREMFRDGYLAWRKQQPLAGLPPKVAELVEQWVGDAEPGWPQIEALIARLRRHARHDPTATLPPDVDDPIAYFLSEAHSGPDYLFATTAAVLLRSLGYPSRMVGGFYSQPRRYRRLAGNTPICAEDVHYWTQTQLPDGTWVNLEPTPEYRSPDPPSGMPRSVSHRWNLLLRWLKANGLMVAMAFAGGVGLVVFRRRVAERAATLAWRLHCRGPAEKSVPATWHLIERRAQLAGRARPPAKTFGAWGAELAAAEPEIGRRLAALAEIADWLAHGRTVASAPKAAAGTSCLCREAGRLCTVATLRRLARPPRPPATPDRRVRPTTGRRAVETPSPDRTGHVTRRDGQASLPPRRSIPHTTEKHDQTDRELHQLVARS